MIFPPRFAGVIGVDLSAQPIGTVYTAGGQHLAVRYAEVELTLAAAANHFVR